MSIPQLYHYTCSDHAAEIRRDGLIKVSPVFGTGGQKQVVWMTDLDVPNKKGLGLTSNLLSCDRTEYRFEITDPRAVFHWNEAKRYLPRGVVEQLEAAPGAMPMHWWVSGLPQRFVLAEAVTR